MTHLTKAEIQQKLEEFAKEYATDAQPDEQIQITLVQSDGTESDLFIVDEAYNYVI